MHSVFYFFFGNYFVEIDAASETNVSNTKYTNVSKAK